MPKFNFENLHPNHKMAYLDGLLCGALIAAIGVKLYQDYREEKALKKEAAEAQNNETK